MSTEYRIDKSVPLPPMRRPAGSVTPEMVRAEDAAKMRALYREQKAKGLCGYGAKTCNAPAAEGHTLCERHLVVMRETAKTRTTKKKANGLCRQCKSPAFEGMAFCLVHRVGKGLPLVVKRGIAEWRKLEARRAEAAKREGIYERLHLLDTRRQEVIRLRFPQDGSEGKTLQQIGDALGLTRERVRQLEEDAMFTIERDVPVPTTGKRGIAGEVIKTLQAMQVGESFVCDAAKKLTVYHYAKLLGYVVTSRRQPDGQFRVWMVSKGQNDNA